MVWRNAATASGAIVSPPSNRSAVSSQSAPPSLRAMKPSRLAAMWIVTRESAFAIVSLRGRQGLDGRGDLAQIVVELMVAAGQAAEAGVRNRARMELGMRRGDVRVRQAVVEINWHAFGELPADLAPWPPIVGRPAALADERRRDQDDRAERDARRLLREGVDQDRSAHGVTDRDRAVVQSRELVPQRCAPCGEVGIAFVG